MTLKLSRAQRIHSFHYFDQWHVDGKGIRNRENSPTGI